MARAGDFLCAIPSPILLRPFPSRLAMNRFKGVDFYHLDELYSEEERMVRDTLREWVDAEFMPVIEQHNRDATFPADLIPKLGEMGTLGASLQGYGCAGLSPIASRALLTSVVFPEPTAPQTVTIASLDTSAALRPAIVPAVCGPTKTSVPVATARKGLFLSPKCCSYITIRSA